MNDEYQEIIRALAFDFVMYGAIRPHYEYAEKFLSKVQTIRNILTRHIDEIREEIRRRGGSIHEFEKVRKKRVHVSKNKAQGRPWEKKSEIDEREITLEEMFSIANGHKRIDKSDVKALRKVSYSLDVKHPIALVMSSDWHFGSLGVTYTKLENDIRFFLENSKYLKMLMVGDIIENCISFPSEEDVLSQVFSPKEMRIFLEKLFDKMAPHIAAMWYGNHDIGRDLRQFGDSFVMRIAKQFEIPFVGGPGPIELNIGNEQYLGFVSHHPKGYSMYNKLHGAIRWLRENCPNAEFVTIAHKHQPAYSWVIEYNRLIHFFALGTYNTGPEYGFRRYGGGGAVGTPALVLWPDEHRTQAFPNVEDAVFFIKALIGEK